MLENISLQTILFLDIETVPEVFDFAQLPAEKKLLWDKKMQFSRREGDTAESLYMRAGVYAEFAKIICISVGYFEKQKTESTFYLKSFYGDNEKHLLLDFSDFLSARYGRKNFFFCAHNGKEFDYPFLARRMLIQRIPLPPSLQLAGKKPWEVKHLDTLELWKFGDYKNFTSLALLANIFSIPSPKEEMEGGDVAPFYYLEKNIKKIVDYCQKDVLTVAQLLLRFKGEELLHEKNVFIVE